MYIDPVSNTDDVPSITADGHGSTSQRSGVAGGQVIMTSGLDSSDLTGLRSVAMDSTPQGLRAVAMETSPNNLDDMDTTDSSSQHINVVGEILLL